MSALHVANVTLDGEPTALRAVDGVIVAIGPDVEMAEDDELLDGHGMALAPGLVNGHGHAAMTLLRGYGDDLRLSDWLEHRIWPAEAKIGADDVYWGTRLACVEMIRSGTTHFWDMYWHPREVARAAVDAGIRATVGQPIMDVDGVPEGARPEDVADGLDELATFGPRIEGSVSPHAIYTVSEPSLQLVEELSRTRAAKVQIHLAETEDEVARCVAEHGCKTAEYLDRLGLLHDRIVLAHCVWLDDDELELIAERGATIVTNPVSNMKLAVGRAFPYGAAKRAGAALGIGTDGAASNNGLDLLADLKVLALLQKHTARDPAVLPAHEAWDLATGASAPLLGGTPLEPGAPADFVLVDVEQPELVPAPLVEALVYSTSSAAIDTVVVDGRVLMRGRLVDGETEVRERAAAAAQRIRQ
jgi:5-methylthioadenosine/S-adenosylhomocysteine deaminase